MWESRYCECCGKTIGAVNWVEIGDEYDSVSEQLNEEAYDDEYCKDCFENNFCEGCESYFNNDSVKPLFTHIESDTLEESQKVFLKDYYNGWEEFKCCPECYQKYKTEAFQDE